MARKPVPRALPLGDQLDHGVAIVGVERGGRLVEDEQRDGRRRSRARC